MGRVRGPADGRASVLGHLREGRRGGGVAVLRYDDRGVGGSTGSVARSTTSDYADDALAGIARLLERADIDPGRIGLVGHSEGAAVASLAASRSDAVRFAVLLAGTSVPGAEVMYEQSAAGARAAGGVRDAREDLRGRLSRHDLELDPHPLRRLKTCFRMLGRFAEDVMLPPQIATPP